MYKEHNVNPKGFKAADCVIRAFALATGKTWEETYTALCELGMKMKGMPNEKRIYEKYAEIVGLKKKKIELVHGRKPTVESFAKSTKKGTYILRVANHLVTVKDGIYYDTWDCGDKSVYMYWQV